MTFIPEPADQNLSMTFLEIQELTGWVLSDFANEERTLADMNKLVAKIGNAIYDDAEISDHFLQTTFFMDEPDVLHRLCVERSTFMRSRFGDNLDVPHWASGTHVPPEVRKRFFFAEKTRPASTKASKTPRIYNPDLLKAGEQFNIAVQQHIFLRKKDSEKVNKFLQGEADLFVTKPWRERRACKREPS